eukprot:TRINITY_DN510_c0_g1_i1.p1 TRINITY_DN510_c0_g1~~TRINITY_DN510_c0_g1_i1.p1  ORF type:complete len:202 (-),score=41.61 TRINITY_DN510_c0_g1_i1:225-830(-)
MIRRPPRSTLSSSSAASDVYKRQVAFTMTMLATSPHLDDVLRCTMSRSEEMHTLQALGCQPEARIGWALWPQWQPSSPIELWSWSLTDSRAAWDCWSMVHLWMGIWIGALLSPLVHGGWMSWGESYGLNLGCHLLFELVENCPGTHWMWAIVLRSDSFAEFRGDSLLNSGGDILSYLGGFEMMRRMERRIVQASEAFRSVQ